MLNTDFQLDFMSMQTTSADAEMKYQFIKYVDLIKSLI